MYHFFCIEFVFDVYVQLLNFDLVNVPLLCERSSQRLFLNEVLAELEHVCIEHRV